MYRGLFHPSYRFFCAHMKAARRQRRNPLPFFLHLEDDSLRPDDSRGMVNEMNRIRCMHCDLVSHIGYREAEDTIIMMPVWKYAGAGTQESKRQVSYQIPHAEVLIK